MSSNDANGIPERVAPRPFVRPGDALRHAISHDHQNQPGSFFRRTTWLRNLEEVPSRSSSSLVEAQRLAA